MTGNLVAFCVDGRCRLVDASEVAGVWPYEALVCMGEKWLEGCWGVVEALPPLQHRDGVMVLGGFIVTLHGEFVEVEGEGWVEVEVPCRGVVRLPTPVRLRVYVWAGSYTARLVTPSGDAWSLVLLRDDAYAYRVTKGGEVVAAAATG